MNERGFDVVCHLLNATKVFLDFLFILLMLLLLLQVIKFLFFIAVNMSNVVHNVKKIAQDRVWMNLEVVENC